MHKASAMHMRRAIRRHIAPLPAGRVLEIGSRTRNPLYRQLWQARGWAHTGCDLQDGPNVDVVLDVPFALPFGDDAYDAVISGQMLEHNPMFWLSFLEMSRVLRLGGMMVHIAPSRGPEHRAPTDCWRFYPDGFRALAHWSGFDMIEAGTDWSRADIARMARQAGKRGQRPPARRPGADTLWGDTVGVFRKARATADTIGVGHIHRLARRFPGARL